jgi:fructose-1-phosphate kinase PfkB-like protein
LHERADTHVLVVIKDKGNAVLVTNEQDWFIEFVASEAGTRSGVWDALLAGYLAEQSRGRSVTESLEWGAAAASYAATQVGNEFGTLQMIAEYLKDVKVSVLDKDTSPGQL